MAMAIWRVNVFILSMTMMICRYANGQMDKFEQDIWSDEVSIKIKNDPTVLFARAAEETLYEEEHFIEKREAPEDAEDPDDPKLEGSGEEPTVPPAKQEKEVDKSPFNVQSLPANPEEKSADVEPYKEVGKEKKALDTAESESAPEKPKEETKSEGGKVEIPETVEKQRESEAKKDGRKLMQEELNGQQRGNAVVYSSRDIFETEQRIGRMQHKESIKSAVAEEPKSGKFTEATDRKCNSLLIVLFVAVLAMGAAAFAYNFIKKRKNRNAARTKQNGADPEEGREMKPLMKTGELTNSVYYIDTTDSVFHLNRQYFKTVNAAYPFLVLKPLGPMHALVASASHPLLVGPLDSTIFSPVWWPPFKKFICHFFSGILKT